MHRFRIPHILARFWNLRGPHIYAYIRVYMGLYSHRRRRHTLEHTRIRPPSGLRAGPSVPGEERDEKNVKVESGRKRGWSACVYAGLGVGRWRGVGTAHVCKLQRADTRRVARLARCCSRGGGDGLGVPWRRAPCPCSCACSCSARRRGASEVLRRQLLRCLRRPRRA